MLGIVHPIEVVQVLTGNDRLYVLNIHRFIGNRPGVPTVRDRLARDVIERVFVFPDFPIQKLAALVASIAGPNQFRDAIIIDIYADVALVIVHKLHALVGRFIVNIEVAGDLFGRIGTASGGNGVDFCLVIAHCHEVGTGLLLPVVRKRRLVGPDRLFADQEFLGRDNVDNKPTVQHLALDLEVIEREHDLPAHAIVKRLLVLLLRQNLGRLVLEQQRRLVLGQTAMERDLVDRLVIIVRLDDAVAHKQRIPSRIIDDLVTLVVLPENVIHALGCLIGKL